MRLRLLLNLVLLAGVAALGIYYWLTPVPEPGTPPRISDLDIDTVSRIEVERPGEPLIELVRRDGHWRLIAPMQANAEDNRIGTILMLPISISASRFSADEVDLEQFGLEPATLTLRFDDASFVIGDENPLDDNQRYLLHDGQVHLFDGRLYQRLNAPLMFYVDPALKPPASRLTGVSLPGRALGRSEGEWTLTPSSADGDAAALGAAWQRARASYVKRLDTDVAADDPVITLEFADRDPVSYRLVTAGPQPLLVRPERELQFHLTPDLAAELGLIEAPANQDNRPRSDRHELQLHGAGDHAH